MTDQTPASASSDNRRPTFTEVPTPLIAWPDPRRCIHFGETADRAPTPREVTYHRCCWCMGSEGATVCHARGHAEAKRLAYVSTVDKTGDAANGGSTPIPTEASATNANSGQAS